jgi:AcrR family transcriptional regulator
MTHVDRRRIVAHAAVKAREVGFRKLSMRSLAADLQISPAALYHHVSCKRELTDLVVDLLIADIRPPVAGPWHARLRTFFDAAYAAFRGVPDVSEVFIQQEPSRQTQARLTWVRETLSEGGLARDEADRVLRALVNSFVGAILLQEQWRAQAPDPASLDDGAADFSWTVARLLAADDGPDLPERAPG